MSPAYSALSAASNDPCGAPLEVHEIILRASCRGPCVNDRNHLRINSIGALVGLLFGAEKERMVSTMTAGMIMALILIG